MNARPVSPRALARQSGAHPNAGFKWLPAHLREELQSHSNYGRPPIDRDHESPVMPPRDPEVPLTFFFRLVFLYKYEGTIITKKCKDTITRK